MPGKVHVAAGVQVFLWSWSSGERPAGKEKVGQAAGDRAFAFRDLIGVGEVDLRPVGDHRRAQSQFPATDDGLLDGQREEQVGLADVVVIEKVVGNGLEVVGIDASSRGKEWSRRTGVLRPALRAAEGSRDCCCSRTAAADPKP